MASVLVVGGAGFIGSHLVRHLAQAGERIVVMDNLSRGVLDEDLRHILATYPKTVTLEIGDLTDPSSLSRLPRGFDDVYLLAGRIGVRRVLADPAAVLRDNALIVLQLLQWLAKRGCRRLLFASTSEVYAGSIEARLAGVPTAEEVPVMIRDLRHPRLSYAISKLFGEAAVAHYARACGFEAVVVRYHNVYGPRMGFDHVVPELMGRIWHREDPLRIYGVDQTRAFCYVTDAVAASVALMRCPLKGQETVHVGTDQEVSIRTLLETLLRLSAFRPAAIRELPAAAGSVARRCPDLTKLRTLTGWIPHVSLDEGLAQTWSWYRRWWQQAAHPPPTATTCLAPT